MGIAATLLFHALYAAWLLIRPISQQVTLRGDEVLGTVGGALAVLLCFLRVPGSESQALWKSRSRQIAFFCGLGIICNTLHHALPIPFLASDTLSLLAYSLLLLGLWRLPRKPLSAASQSRASLDGLMGTISALTFIWYFVLGPIALSSAHRVEEKVVSVLSLTMNVLIAGCLLLLGRQTGSLRSVLLLFSTGLILVVASDSGVTSLLLYHPFAAGTLLDLGRPLGLMLIGVAVFTGRRVTTATKLEDEPEGLPSLCTSLLPYAFLPLVAALALYTDLTPSRAGLRHGVFWGAFLLVCQVFVRQVLALRENREMNSRLEALVTTDPLTGLCNHLTFHKRLAEEAARASREGQMLLVAMLDLDNFKFFNDAYGHAVGDDVLRQITQALRENLMPEDTVARFGGDEFALIMPLKTVGAMCQGVSPEGLRQSLEMSLGGLFFQPPGSPQSIPMTISLGVALFPEEAGSHLEALELAERRLIHVKTGGSSEHPAEQLCHELTLSLSGFSMLNALVTAVDNKDRYTRRHSEDVLTYSLQIADQLQLDPETRHTMQIAALLHDVGKIGVPDRILRKPSHLTDEEYRAVQQHPVMGAVIVGAVAGFEETLDVVRHHHERWDGTGYPFGLVGTETPFLARLVSVADAFSAMTTDRPYRKGMKRAKALRILEEGAGTQWDPECVEALLRAYRPVEKMARAA